MPLPAAVLGLGRSGLAAARLLRHLGHHPVTLLDTAPEEKLPPGLPDRLRAEGHPLVTGPHAPEHPPEAHLIVTSPGVPLHSPLTQALQRRNPHAPLIGELELASRHTTLPIIAITGTNGKTTTTELTAAALNHAGKTTTPAGNIGLPLSEHLLAPHHDQIHTLEVSSFQLEATQTFHPHIAAWLNFTPDHLDHHPDLEHYLHAKLRIFHNQTPDDHAIVNARDLPLLAPHLRVRPENIHTFSACGLPAHYTLTPDHLLAHHGQPILPLHDTRLRGPHNAENLLATLAIAHALRLPHASILPALTAYPPAPHRCEHIATRNHIEYINDSKGTNPDATAQALALHPHSPVILILGGKNKGFDFTPLTPHIQQRCRALILIGETTPALAAHWSHLLPCHPATDMPHAVHLATTHAHPGDTILLSPGTSSFDMFKSYADRGDQFRQAVQALPK